MAKEETEEKMMRREEAEMRRKLKDTVKKKLKLTRLHQFIRCLFIRIQRLVFLLHPFLFLPLRFLLLRLDTRPKEGEDGRIHLKKQAMKRLQDRVRVRGEHDRSINREAVITLPYHHVCHEGRRALRSLFFWEFINEVSVVAVTRIPKGFGSWGFCDGEEGERGGGGEGQKREQEA